MMQTCTPQHNNQQLMQATSQSFITSPQGYNVWAMTPEPINPNIPVQIAMPEHLNHQSPIACESRLAPTTRNNVNTPTLIDSDQYHSKFIAEINSKLDFVISKVTKIDELEHQFSNMNSDIILIKQQQSAFETSLSFFPEKFDEQLRSSSRVSEQISERIYKHNISICSVVKNH